MPTYLTGYLVDYLIENRSPSLFALLLRHAEQRLLGEGVKAIICTVATSPYRGVLRRHGFYPAIFRRQSYLAAGVHLSDPRLQVFSDVRQWFVTMGDGDLEMSF